jgi:hypothetical protein
MDQLLRETSSIRKYSRAQELSGTVCVVLHHHLPAFVTRGSLLSIFLQSLAKGLDVGLHNLIWPDFEKPEKESELVAIPTIQRELTQG